MRAERSSVTARSLIAILCAIALVPGDALAYPVQQASAPASAQPAQAAPAQATPTQATKIPADQLDSLVAPIALYPDPLLAQILAASTYPLEIIQLQQWLGKNKNLKDKQLADAVAKESWDASVQALAALPQVVELLGNNIKWTTDLGNAFLAQEGDVMDAAQRMRKKAQEKGNLKSNEQQKVETTVVQNKSVIVIEPAKPDVIYVPSYDPVVVYGAPYYPYPPIYYPHWGYYAAGAAISFGFGVMMGAFWSGGWGWGCGWGGNNVYINNNNNFNRNTNINRGNRASTLPSRAGGVGGVGGVGGAGGIGGVGGVGGAGGVGGVGGAGGVGGPGGVGGAGGVGGPGGVGGAGGVGGPGGVGGVGGGNGASTLPAGGAGGRSNWTHNPEHRGGAPYRDRATADRFGGNARGDSLAQRQAGARQQIARQGNNFGSSSGFGNRSGGSGLGNRAGGGNGGAGIGNRGSGFGGADSIGGRNLSRSGGGNRDAFGGGTRGYDGSRARNSSSRGSSSLGSRSGGFSRSGGGGFSRGGGGGRRR